MTRTPGRERDADAEQPRPTSTWLARFEGLGWVFTGMIGIGAGLAWLAELLGPDIGALVWLAGLASIALGVPLLVLWGGLWVVLQTIRANRPAATSRRRGRRLSRS